MTAAPVPPIVDADRYEGPFTIGSSTPSYSLSYPVFGTGEDLIVLVNGAALSTSLWTFSSLSGIPINQIDLPITDGVITFNPPLTTGSLVIQYLWNPRTGTLPNTPGIARREFNQDYAQVVASLRELFYLYQNQPFPNVIGTVGAPSNSTGVNGQLAWDATNYILYGPKVNGVWPPGVNLQGPAGTSPNEFRTGSGVPSSGLGINGDIYYDYTNHNIYGPKSGGAWGSATSLIGPTGATGSTGSTGATGPAGVSSGAYVNRFRNGTMGVWQRGPGTITVAAGTPAYTADGWIVTATGASVAVTQTAGLQNTEYALTITGAASVTDATIKQRIESYDAAILQAGTLAGPVYINTVQFLIKNNTGGTITPTLTVNTPTAADNYTSVTALVSAQPFASIANATTAVLAYSFIGPANANGMEVIIDFGNNFSSNAKSVTVSEFDIRAGQQVSAGIQASPPIAELRSIHAEISQCQRHFATSYPNGTAPGTSTANGSQGAVSYSGSTAIWIPIRFPQEMRATPTLTSYSTTGASGKIRDNSGSADVAAAQQFVGATGGLIDYASATVGHAYICHWTASAEL